jgi:hypothetical protein
MTFCLTSRRSLYFLISYKNRLPRRGTEGGEKGFKGLKSVMPGGSSAALHNGILSDPTKEGAQRIDNICYVKPGRVSVSHFRRSIFFFQLKKENPLSWRLRSSLNIHLSELPKKGVRAKKGMVGIIRLG